MMQVTIEIPEKLAERIPPLRPKLLIAQPLR
jgi:hypothetical protein